QVRLNEGPKGANRYRIVLSAFVGVQSIAGSGVQAGAGVQSLAGLQSSAATPAKDCAKPLQCIADKPSLNRQEPSVLVGQADQLAKKSKLPKCPSAEIVAIYNEVLPELPGAKLV